MPFVITISSLFKTVKNLQEKTLNFWNVDFSKFGAPGLLLIIKQTGVYDQPDYYSLVAWI